MAKLHPSLEKICIVPSLPIQQAIQVLNDGHKRIALIVDHETRLLGVIADADIRRALLNGQSFASPVSEIMIKTPVVASQTLSDNAIFALMQTTKCYEIPILDHKKRVVDLKLIDDFVSQQHQAEVIIMAGGRGMRLRPLTEAIPKPLIPVGERPILFILLDQLVMTGFQKITLALNYKATMIKEAVYAIPKYAHFVRFIEEDDQLGTAGSLSLLENPPTSPFFVINADLLTKVDFMAMLRFHEMEKNDITMAVREERYQIPFGVVTLDGTHITRIDEKPIYTYFANGGIYILNPSVLQLVPNKTMYNMPDLINDALTEGKHIGSFPIHEYWLDIGRPDELQQARNDVSSARYQ